MSWSWKEMEDSRADTDPCASDSEESTKSNPTPSSSSPPPFPLERLERQDAMPMPPGYFY